MLIGTSPAFEGDLGSFGAPGERHACGGAPDFASELLERAIGQGIPVAQSAHRVLDHGLLVPLHFLDPEARYTLAPISQSFVSTGEHRKLGALVCDVAAAAGLRVAFLASGDLSHRLTPDAPAGYSPRGDEYDRLVVSIVDHGSIDDLESIDPGLVSEAGECGQRSFVMLAGFLSRNDVTTRVLAYEAPWGVGYLTAVAAPAERLDRILAVGQGSLHGTAGEQENPIVSLARSSIDSYVRRKKTISAPDSPEFSQRAGVFVSLHLGGELRGCIGTIDPTYPTLGEEIVTMAIHAATQDPRFPPVSIEELADLEIKVDVLGAMEQVSDESDLDPGTYGVVVSRDWRRGVLLPDLPGVDSVEAQLDIARRKAGISRDEDFRIERFRVDRFR